MPIKKRIINGILLLIAIGIVTGILWKNQWSIKLGTTTVQATMEDAAFVTAGPFNVLVTMLPDPPKVGNNKISVMVRDANKQMVSGAKVRAVAEMPAMGSMPAMRSVAEFTEIAPGEFVGDLALGMSGEWPLAVDIEVESIGHTDLIFDMATGRSGLALASATQGDIAHYTCAMHPSVKNATPGTCPICGMDLVPVSHAELNAGTITIDQKRRQLIGVTTGVVTSKIIRKSIHAVGRITYDETRLSDVSLKYDAWIGVLYSNYVGAPVKKGDPLFTVYSPALLTAQEEYLEAIKHRTSKGTNYARFTDAAKHKLQLLDITTQQIKALARNGKSLEQLPILATTNGTVIKKHVVAGSAVKSGQPVLRIADLSKVWAEAQLYDHELPHINVGMPATVILPDLQDREFQGTVSYVYPFMENDTRTARVRVVLDNADGFLRPDMYVQITLRPDFGERLVVPESAVLYAGQTRVAFIDLGEGRLQPRRIKTGIRNRNYIEVIDGLKEGDKVVTSGNFLIAAEAKLKTGVEQW